MFDPKLREHLAPVIALMSNSQLLTAPSVVDGAVNGEFFLAYVKQTLGRRSGRETSS